MSSTFKNVPWWLCCPLWSSYWSLMISHHPWIYWCETISDSMCRELGTAFLYFWHLGLQFRTLGDSIVKRMEPPSSIFTHKPVTWTKMTQRLGSSRTMAEHLHTDPPGVSVFSQHGFSALQGGIPRGTCNKHFLSLQTHPQESSMLLPLYSMVLVNYQEMPRFKKGNLDSTPWWEARSQWWRACWMGDIIVLTFKKYSLIQPSTPHFPISSHWTSNTLK